MIIAKIAKIQDKYRVIINKGSKDGIKKDMKFYVYEEGEDITDPDTNEIIEREEIVKANMKVLHVQEKISILESDEIEKITIQSPYINTFQSLSYLVNINGETREVMKPLNVNKEDLKDQEESNYEVRDKNKIIKKGDFVKQLTV